MRFKKKFEDFSLDEQKIIDDIRSIFQKIVKKDLSNVIYRERISSEIEKKFHSDENIKYQFDSKPIPVKIVSGSLFSAQEVNLESLYYQFFQKNEDLNYGINLAGNCSLNEIKPLELAKNYFYVKNNFDYDFKSMNNIIGFFIKNNFFIKIPDKRIYQKGEYTVPGAFGNFVYFIADLHS